MQSALAPFSHTARKPHPRFIKMCNEFHGQDSIWDEQITIFRGNMKTCDNALLQLASI
jgi:hypothetical protein